MADLLAAIVAATRRSVDDRRRTDPLAALERAIAASHHEAGRFARALTRRDTINVIAECKRRSPSKGVLRDAYDPVAIAREYEAAGASAISVLTEPSFFDGSLDDLRAVRTAVKCPLLRKDFVIDEYQLFEARAAGADAILLIVAALDQRSLTLLTARAQQLALDVLVEVHDEDELRRALDAGAAIVGVNNRNLRTLSVATRVSEQLASQIPNHVTAVAESGLRTLDDLQRLGAMGYRAFLIGERFMTAPHPGDALRDLLRGGAAVQG
jgi:indole-3-glycerol phosphate synthase